ncbi:hypothetical protein K2F54_05345 [Cryobacterium sp. 1639]|uniref:hypothetical protein n=1 Tax=Cryobacterium inferilacus TaxID=2866629 RepID=UPI001C72DAA9|nr:hypothetical protein [Cryobacterium sp. 1639]MBX0299401.1 hypothetical protein [Cryobacterium sp. 1639]
MNHRTRTTSDTATLTAPTTRVQAWLEAHPNLTHEPVVSIMRAGFSPEERAFILDMAVTKTRSATDKDWNGHTVATRAGFVVKPDSLMMRSLCNGDAARAGDIDRARFFVNAGE